MKMRTIYLFSLSLVITFIFSSCKDDDVITHDQVKEKPSLLTEANNENYSLDEAKKLANDFFNTLDGVNKLIWEAASDALSCVSGKIPKRSNETVEGFCCVQPAWHKSNPNKSILVSFIQFCFI